jgi:signal transduction histidine kinase
MRHGMELGADDYLPKPFTIEALYGAVEARLKKAKTLREDAERKLADLRDNISMMLPHELRTPLNGILAYGEILTADAATLQPDEIAEMGQVIYQSGKRLERLVENFLIYGQMELLGTDPQKVAGLRRQRTPFPGPLIEEHARSQAKQANRPGELVLKLEDVVVPMAEDYLSKIVDELVSNAFKFSKAGTFVRVELSEVPEAVLLSVGDQGRGFSTDHITKIGAYMQFDRKLHEQQGLGLGLTIARRLTELHGGTLAIQSDKGAGASITMRLPKWAAS